MYTYIKYTCNGIAPGCFCQSKGGQGTGNSCRICYNTNRAQKQQKEANCMQYVQLFRTGLKISRLGFGGIPNQRIDQPGTRELLKAAHEMGVNYIDTARAYTVSEEWIGQSLEELGLRDAFVLATKCRALTKADMEAELAQSLKNL